MGGQKEEIEQLALDEQGLGRLEWEDQTWRKRGGGARDKIQKGTAKTQDHMREIIWNPSMVEAANILNEAVTSSHVVGQSGPTGSPPTTQAIIEGIVVLHKLTVRPYC